VLARIDEYLTALSSELREIRVDPDADPEVVAALIADAEARARTAVAARWLAEARDRRDEAAQRAKQAAERQAAAENAANAARKQLARVDGGDRVDLDGRYYAITARDLYGDLIGAVAYPAGAEEARHDWPPIIASKRSTLRLATGAELAGVEGLAAVVATPGEARTRLLDLAAERAKPPVGVGEITED
jgi:hypothetical protein